MPGSVTSGTPYSSYSNNVNFKIVVLLRCTLEYTLKYAVVRSRICVCVRVWVFVDRQ